MYKSTAVTRTQPNITKRTSQAEGLGLSDVICGRHRDSSTNVGNRRFRILVALMTPKYMNAPTRAHKSMVMRDIVDAIHNCGGRFVHHQKGTTGTTWQELEDKQMYDKIGHAFRDMTVSLKAKSDINKLLSPCQPDSSKLPLDNFVQICNDTAHVPPSSRNVTITPAISYNLSLSTVQDSDRHEAQVSINDESSNSSEGENTEDDSDNWTFQDDYHYQFIFNDGAGYNVNSDDFNDAGQQWRRDSIKSFQLMVL